MIVIGISAKIRITVYKEWKKLCVVLSSRFAIICKKKRHSISSITQDYSNNTDNKIEMYVLFTNGKSKCVETEND